MRQDNESYCRCLYFSTAALTRTLTRMAEENFAGTGLAPSLGFIVMTVNAEPGIAAGRLAEIMELRPSTITRLIDKLERRGFVRREKAGKYILHYPLPKGKMLDAALRSAWKGLYRRYVKILGERESLVLAADCSVSNRKLS
jgi:DNA-binding MarR family transcriptional regulator